MDFEWNETKNETNIAKHGIDFCYAINIFNNQNRLAWVDDRKDYGEIRYITIGEIEAFIYIVVYTTIRNGVYRIISARGANRNERETYQNYTKERNEPQNG